MAETEGAVIWHTKRHVGALGGGGGEMKQGEGVQWLQEAVFLFFLPNHRAAMVSMVRLFVIVMSCINIRTCEAHTYTTLQV